MPSARFDGNTSATFTAVDISINTTSCIPKNGTRGDSASANAEKDKLDISSSVDGSTTAQQAQLARGTLPESQGSIDPTLDDTCGLGLNATASASFNVTFYHCETGQVWKPFARSRIDLDGDTHGSCKLCMDVVEGASEVSCVAIGVVLVPPDTLSLTDPLRERTTKYRVPKRVFFIQVHTIARGYGFVYRA